MYLVEYLSGELEIVSNSIFTQSWFDKSKICKFYDIGDYSLFFNNNIMKLRDLIAEGKLKCTRVTNYIQSKQENHTRESRMIE